jgi:RNA polymerase sigma-70 factor (ECF subfamily)
MASASRRPADDLARLQAYSSIQLLELARAGHSEAVEVLFARYLGPLQRWASGRLPRWARDISDTQDLVQDTLLRTLGRIASFEPETPDALERYLRRAVMNRIRDEFRTVRRRQPMELLESAHPDVAPSPLDRAITAEWLEGYESALARLRPEDRDAIVGRIEMGLSYDELADAIGRPNANAARSAVVRAIVRLAQEMRGE